MSGGPLSTPFFGRTAIHLDKTKTRAPHLVSKTHAFGRQWLKTAALTPLLILSVVVHGTTALAALCAAASGALIAEAAGAWIFRRKINYHDGESVFLGLFCAVILPWTLSVWFFFAAALITVFWGREIFGGFGQSIVFPPAVGLLVLFMGFAPMIQAFDFKSARSLDWAANEAGHGALDFWSLLFYPSSASAEDLSFLALAAGAVLLILLRWVSWTLPLLGFLGYAAGCFLLKEKLVWLSGGFWLTLFFGLSQTSALPLKTSSRWVYAACAGFFSAVCPLSDPALCSLSGLGLASLLVPWIELAGSVRLETNREAS